MHTLGGPYGGIKHPQQMHPLGGPYGGHFSALAIVRVTFLGCL